VTGERFANLRRLDRPAPESDRVNCVVFEQRPNQLGLAPAKLKLSRGGEERRDRLTEPPLELAIGIDGAQAGAPGRLRGLRLARPHEADEDELALGRTA
jgi:hypothetical protein